MSVHLVTRRYRATLLALTGVGLLSACDTCRRAPKPDPRAALLALADEMLVSDPTLSPTARTTTCASLKGRRAKPGLVPVAAAVDTLKGAATVAVAGLDHDDLVLVFERGDGPPYVVAGCGQGGDSAAIPLASGTRAFWVFGWSLSADSDQITVSTGTASDQVPFVSAKVDREYNR